MCHRYFKHSVIVIFIRSWHQRTPLPFIHTQYQYTFHNDNKYLLERASCRGCLHYLCKTQVVSLCFLYRPHVPSARCFTLKNKSLKTESFGVFHISNLFFISRNTPWFSRPDRNDYFDPTRQHFRGMILTF